jgi:glycosyltransferase involved in cell wall biosynthesis
MKESAPFSEKLLIVSHVVHYDWQGHLYAYAPYAREIEMWADIFSNVAIAAPRRDSPPPADCAMFEHTNIRVIPQRELGGETFSAKLKLALHAPAMLWDLSRGMREADAIHVRCPGNIGLLGAALAPLFSRKLVAKFAGQWSPQPKDAWSTKLQRRLLSSRWWHGPVTVYGKWPNQPEHVVPFFSSAFTDQQMSRAQRAVINRAPGELNNILFVGRLSRAKNVDVLLQALARVHKQGLSFKATIAGEGPESVDLQAQSVALGLSDRVQFTGGVSSDRIIDFLEHSGILVLASETEGWPKAIVEAMAFGLVTIGSNVGLIPEIMSEGRGITVPPRDVDALTAALQKVLSDPAAFASMRARAAEWGGRYTLEYLRSSLRVLLAKKWGIPVPEVPQPEPAPSSRVPVESIR